jgi:hypothetical protein
MNILVFEIFRTEVGSSQVDDRAAPLVLFI